jgi:maleylpyruvate isomerase
LQSAIGLLAAADWANTVVTAQGRTIPAAHVPWLRLREVAIHHVDLGASFDELPAELAAALLDDVLTSLRTRPGWPPMQIDVTDGAHGICVGDEPPTHLSGTAAQLVGWLTGRTSADQLIIASGLPPTLPAWL